ncbi:E3 SUMO-protein ligase KIAA1586 [Merluccius polli]|uniref:E3 SUMO-protein ligase KIAA1586 n=1 Tax=Merluccius polli TaxID=89951 RepID=A0AA47MX04_MERPO|nr:E3 SUMO-protein ligase KIAA1586 [Merluccius polli]
MDHSTRDVVSSAAAAANASASTEAVGSSTGSSPFHVWSEEMWATKKQIYPWIDSKDGKLGCKVCCSNTDLSVFKIHGSRDEWRAYSVSPCGVERSKMLTSLRKKIMKHQKSYGHMTAQRILDNAKKETLEKVCDRMNTAHVQATCAVFRTAYHIALSNRPFSDHFGLLDLQGENGVDIGIGLHSRYSAAQIVDHIAEQMRKKACQRIQTIKGKVSVLIDESTSLGSITTLIVYLKCETDKNFDPHFVFLELIELPNQWADTIVQHLLKCLSSHGFDDAYLRKHLVAFASDGASVMLGRKSGVAKQLSERYPNILTWHCLNHRLELAVGDTVLDVRDVNHFQAFMDKLYTIYSRSPHTLGRVLSTRWVASSFRTVSAVWHNFDSLSAHFSYAKMDERRSASDRNVYGGLLKRLSSKQFVLDLALMYDALHELALLSESLQKRTTSVTYADRLINRSIRVIDGMGEHPRTKVLAALTAVSEGRLSTVLLGDNPKTVSIDRQQFLRSLSNNLRHRLFTTASGPSVAPEAGADYASLISQLKVLDRESWPPAQTMPTGYGEMEISQLCKRFGLPTLSAINGFRDFIESTGDATPDDLRPLMNCTKVIPCSTAECERGFSEMNLVITPTRTKLLIERVSALMFIHLHGPPLKQWNPEEYVKTWLRCHRSAEDRRMRPASDPRNTTHPDPLWRFI